MATYRSVVIAALLVLLPLPLGAIGPGTMRAAETKPSAVIVGAYEAEILACPRVACAVLGSIPLHDRVLVTGIPIDGFVPVWYEQRSGFVAETFLWVPGAGILPPHLEAGEPGCDRVALIFNIGSGFEPATSILDTLAVEHVPATMFVMGWWAEQNVELLRRMVASGLPIGSHGHLPPELTLRSDADVAADVLAAEEAIERAIGEPPGPWFTPYAAAIDDRVRAIVADEGYLPIGWSVRSEDWNPAITAEGVYQNVVPNVRDGSIVELHMDASTSLVSTAVALPWMIRDLRAAGYRFVTVAEMAAPCPVAASVSAPTPPLPHPESIPPTPTPPASPVVVGPPATPMAAAATPSPARPPTDG